MAPLSVTTTDKGVLGYNPSDLHTRKYTNLQGNVQTATTAAVSIGNGKTLTRQLLVLLQVLQILMLLT